MGDLRPGDSVFDEHGRPTPVVAVSPVMTGHRCYAVRFSDGSTIVADADHLWTTLAQDRSPQSHGVRPDAGDDQPSRPATRLGGPVGTSSWVASAETATTAQLAAHARRYAIPAAGPLRLPAVELPTDPYLLGRHLARQGAHHALRPCAVTPTAGGIGTGKPGHSAGSHRRARSMTTASGSPPRERSPRSSPAGAAPRPAASTARSCARRPGPTAPTATGSTAGTYGPATGNVSVCSRACSTATSRHHCGPRPSSPTTNSSPVTSTNWPARSAWHRCWPHYLAPVGRPRRHHGERLDGVDPSPRPAGGR